MTALVEDVDAIWSHVVDNIELSVSVFTTMPASVQVSILHCDT